MNSHSYMVWSLIFSSNIIQDLKEECLDTPTEITESSRAQQILTRAQKEKEEYEENNFIRLPVTKAEKHRQRKLTTLGTCYSTVHSQELHLIWKCSISNRYSWRRDHQLWQHQCSERISSERIVKRQKAEVKGTVQAPRWQETKVPLNFAHVQISSRCMSQFQS